MATPRRIQPRTPLLDASAAVRLQPRLMRPPTPNGNENRGSCWQRRSQPARTRSARRLIRRAPTNLLVTRSTKCPRRTQRRWARAEAALAAVTAITSTASRTRPSSGS